MDMEPFGALTKVPTGTHARVLQLRLSAVERLRRLEEAIAFLRHHLAAGPQPAKSAGIAERTLHRAKDVLGVTTEHTGRHRQWVWAPPPADVLAPQAAIVKS